MGLPINDSVPRVPEAHAEISIEDEKLLSDLYIRTSWFDAALALDQIEKVSWLFEHFREWIGHKWERKRSVLSGNICENAVMFLGICGMCSAVEFLRNFTERCYKTSGLISALLSLSDLWHEAKWRKKDFRGVET